MEQLRVNSLQQPRFPLKAISGISLAQSFLPVRISKEHITRKKDAREFYDSFYKANFAILVSICVFFILFVRKLEHPHIVKFYGTSLLKKAGTTRVILVMEKCKGNLKSQMFGRPELAPSKTRNPAVFITVYRWAKEITDALAFIHKTGGCPPGPQAREHLGMLCVL